MPRPTITCQQCQRKNPASHRFCARCGVALSPSPVDLAVPGTDNLDATTIATDQASLPVPDLSTRDDHPLILPATAAQVTTHHRRIAIAAVLALAVLGGIGAGAVLVLRRGGMDDGRAMAKAADCQAGDLPWGQTLALLNDGSAPSGPFSPAIGQIAEWSRQLRRSDSGAFVECSVSNYASAAAAQAAYTEVTSEIENNDFLTTLLASPMSKLAGPGIGDASAAYEGQSASGSNRHSIIVVFRKETVLGIVRFREGTTTLQAKDALVVARAMGGRLSTGDASMTERRPRPASRRRSQATSSRSP